MKDDRDLFFYYHSDLKLPKKIIDTLNEARKEGKGLFTALVLKDEKGNKIELTMRKDKRLFYERIDKVMRGWLDLVVEKMLRKR